MPKKIKCGLCRKLVSSHDLMYPKAHYECMKNLYKELEAVEIIEILSMKGI
ncbi:MAG: hypothetical protein QCH99_00820 [Candidatus Bathyarchaeota archaeon]|nr:hypothetical protein [Candidatus Bathyarchaeum tardum]